MHEESFIEKPLPKLKGVVLAQARGGKTYWYRFWREGGRLRKEYVPLHNVEAVRLACELRREQERAERHLRKAAVVTLRGLRELARQSEAMVRV